MAVSAGMIAKAAATVLSNEKLRKGVGWTPVSYTHLTLPTIPDV